MRTSARYWKCITWLYISRFKNEAAFWQTQNTKSRWCIYETGAMSNIGRDTNEDTNSYSRVLVYCIDYVDFPKVDTRNQLRVCWKSFNNRRGLSLRRDGDCRYGRGLPLRVLYNPSGEKIHSNLESNLKGKKSSYQWISIKWKRPEKHGILKKEIKSEFKS